MVASEKRWKLSIDRAHLDHAKIVQVPRSAGDLAPGEVELRLGRFAMTANNVTYALLGDSFGGLKIAGGYWDFFPGEPDEGLLPVWGLADIVHSTTEGLEPGSRIFGIFPLASHVRMQPDAIRPTSFIDAVPHRRALPAVYQQYTRMPATTPEDEDLWAVFRPLLLTGFVLADQLTEDEATERIVVASASSKTALLLAHCLRCLENSKTVVGLTSSGNIDFVRDTGLYDKVLTYDELTGLEQQAQTAYVDLAGNGEITARTHTHLGAALRSSILVGKSHWSAAMAPRDLPGPAPEPFFAPARIEKRIGDWGRAEFGQRTEGVWSTALERLREMLDIVRGQGPEAALETYQSLLRGGLSARQAQVVTLG